MKLCLLLALAAIVSADIHFQFPPGSNNRLDGQGRAVSNNARLFDSQNNNRGGYNVGSGATHYYVGSKLTFEWTNQHQCGGEKGPAGPDGKNTHCEIIFQYMCGKDVRDGTERRTIPDNRNQCLLGNCNRDYRFGMHENYDYYANCKWRSRNYGLFTADQKVEKDRATHTRQNPKGTRRGYECPEERDYYPYWSPSPWKDIAILTTDTSRCAYYQENSQNVKETYVCVPPEDHRGSIPIRKEICEALKNENGETGKWVTVPPKGIPAPECLEAPYSRDNHLGNGLGGHNNMYNWTVPDDPEMRGESVGCILRMRYNISTADYPAWSGPSLPADQTKCKPTKEKGFCVKGDGSDQNSGVKKINGDNIDTEAKEQDCLAKCKATAGVTGCETIKDQGNRGCYAHTEEVARGNGANKHYCWILDGNYCTDNKTLEVAKNIGLPVEEAVKRGYEFKNNPNVQLLNSLDPALNEKFVLQLAVNTAQFGRTFQDRTHYFEVKERPDNVPASAKIINLGVRGKRGNIVQTYPATEYDFVPNRLEMDEGDFVHMQWDGSNDNPNNNAGQGKAGTDRHNAITLRGCQYQEGQTECGASTTHGQWGQNYPVRSLKEHPLLGLPMEDLLLLAQVPPGNELDHAATYVNLGLRKCPAGEWNYVCTRNNNFTNRSQKGKITCKPKTAGK